MADRDDSPTYEELEAELAAAKKKNAELEKQIKELLTRIGELERAPKRQAAPFSKGPPKKKAKKPGRKKGKSPWFTRAVPEHVDETLEAALPCGCPDCGAELELVREADQYQTDLPPSQPVTRRFRIAVGRCTACGKRVQGRHPLQISDALGAASVQLGPRVLSLGSVLNKRYGLSWEKVSSSS
jgi:transposase